MDVFPRWISKPQIRKHKNHSATSKGEGRFAHILHAFKKSQYNVRNCKSGRHNQRHTFRHHNTRYKPSLTNIPYYNLKAKERKNRKTKTQSPHQRNLMRRALNLCQDTSNNHLLMDSGYDNHPRINLPYCQHPNQVDSSIDPQDKVILTKVLTRPTKKSRSVGPHKSIPIKSRNKMKSRLENKKIRSASKPLYGRFANEINDNGLKLQQHLLYKSEDKNNYPLMDTSTSISTVC